MIRTKQSYVQMHPNFPSPKFISSLKSLSTKTGDVLNLSFSASKNS